MKIRDIDAYVKSIAPEADIRLLGTDKEPLFKAFTSYNKPLDNYVTNIASFATNVEEQLFYEFTQNAYDADAKDLMFFADEKFLIVLNNGTPFYTDHIPSKDDGQGRVGQLYSFLGKNASQKYNDDSEIGQFGQGSKLLYLLMLDAATHGNSSDTIAESLRQRIIKEKKAPYLISWEDDIQLENLLSILQPDSNQTGWQYSQNTQLPSLMFLKISHTYFPIAAGQHLDYFSDNEAKTVLRAFEDLVNPFQLRNRLRRGSALIIPLGDGMKEKIMNKGNLKNVQSGLNGFLSTIGLERKSGASEELKRKSLKTIRVFGDELDQLPVTTRVYSIDKKDYTVSFNPSFSKSDFVNFYKGLPIISTKYRLGFAINSSRFETDDSRQRVNNVDKLQLSLSSLFTDIADDLRDMKAKDDKAFMHCYESVLASMIYRLNEGKNIAEIAYVKKPFDQVLGKYFEENALTIDKKIVHSNQLLCFDYHEYVDAETLFPGKNYFWTTEENKNGLDQRFDIKIKKIEIESLCREAATDSYAKWLPKLDVGTYIKLVSEIVQLHDSITKNVPYLLSNKGLVYTIEELLNPENDVFFAIEGEMQNDMFKDSIGLEYIICPVQIVKRMRHVLRQKLTRYASLFQDHIVNLELAAKLLECLYKKNENATMACRVFRNELGEYPPLSNLILKTPDDVCVLDKFRLLGHKPKSLPQRWFCNDYDGYHEWLEDEDNYQAVLTKLKWGGSATLNYLRDITKIYSEAGDSQKCLSLSLDEFGCPTNDCSCVLECTENLTPEEYNLLRELVPEHCLVPIQYAKPLLDGPFAVNIVYTSQVISEETEITKNQLNIFLKLDNGIFDNYSFEERNGSLYIYKLKHSNVIAPYVTGEIVQLLEKTGISIIPEQVQRAYQQLYPTIKLDDLYLINNRDVLEQLIERYYNEVQLLELWPLFRQACIIPVLEAYLKALPSLEINNLDCNLIWELLNMGKRFSSDNPVKSKLRLSGQSLPETIYSADLVVANRQFNLYEILPNVLIANEVVDEMGEVLGNVEKLKTVLYDEMEDILPQDAVNQLLDTVSPHHLTLQQFEFMYTVKKIAPELSTNIADYGTDESASTFLDYMLERELIGFDHYWVYNNEIIRNKLLANPKYLLEDERMPKEIDKWLQEHQSDWGIFKSPERDSKTPFLRLRIAVDKDEFYQWPEDITIEHDNKTWQNTLTWINKYVSLQYDSRGYHSLYKSYSGYSNSESLEYNYLSLTGEVAPVGDNKFVPLVSFTAVDKNMAYIDGADKEFLISLSEHAYNKIQLANLIKRHRPVIVDTSLPLFSQLKDNGNQWRVEHALDNSDQAKEWNSQIYQDWLATNVHYRIYLSSVPLSAKYRLVTSGDEELYSISTSDDTIAIDEGNNIYLHLDNASLTNIIHELENYARLFKDYPQELVDLLKLYRDSLELFTKERSEDESLSPSEIDEGKELHINVVSGCLGECLYRMHLRETLGEDGFVHSSFDKNEPAYDFYNKIDDTYVEIKTTISSIEGEDVPIYFHKSQHAFLRQKPEAEYYITRISLTDLGLADKAYHYRDKYAFTEMSAELEQEMRETMKEIAETWYRRKLNKKRFADKLMSYSIKIHDVLKD